jgi:hypothetical protein
MGLMFRVLYMDQELKLPGFKEKDSGLRIQDSGLDV